MKLVVVDVGNTSTAIGLWSDGRVSHVAHCDGGFDEAAKAAARLLSRVPARVPSLKSPLASRASRLTPSLLAYVSVVPAEDAKWRRFAKEHGLGIHRVSWRDFGAAGMPPQRWCGILPRPDGAGGMPPQRGCGILPHPDSKGRARDARLETREDARLETRDATLRIDYPRPATIGADRLADAAGAVRRYGAPVLVMDFGTALTAAVVTRDRVWRGGVIAPGFPLMRDYLFERTAKLPRMKLPVGGRAGSGRGWTVPKIGRSTEEAMRFGALVGYRGMVREIVATLKANFNEDFRLVATGGFARWVLRDLDLDFTVDPTLTLFGAGLIAAERFHAEVQKREGRSPARLRSRGSATLPCEDGGRKKR